MPAASRAATVTLTAVPAVAVAGAEIPSPVVTPGATTIDPDVPVTDGELPAAVIVRVPAPRSTTPENACTPASVAVNV